jgi:hypothetical protein
MIAASLNREMNMAYAALGDPERQQLVELGVDPIDIDCMIGMGRIRLSKSGPYCPDPEGRWAYLTPVRVHYPETPESTCPDSVVRFGDKLIGKELGLFVERREVGQPGDFEHLSDEELEAALAEKLTARGMTPEQVERFLNRSGVPLPPTAGLTYRPGGAAGKHRGAVSGEQKTTPPRCASYNGASDEDAHTAV